MDPWPGSLKVKPTDLTRISARELISGEEQLRGGHGTREMRIWGPIFFQIAWDVDLGSVRVDNLAHYLEGMQGE
ncbi:MAG: hypothetical protein ABSB35_32560 [Bryobacteraceae bacterium]